MLDVQPAPALALAATEGDPALIRREPGGRRNAEEPFERVPKGGLGPARTVTPPKDGGWLDAEGARDALLGAADLHKFSEGASPRRIGNVRHVADTYANRPFCQTGSSTILRYLEPRSAKQRPSAASLGPLAKAIGTSTAYLLDGEGPMLVEEVQEPETTTDGAVDAGLRRFREYVRDREAQHAHLLPAFLAWRAQGASRYPATITALDVEEELVLEFRRWRRGQDQETAAAAPQRSRTGRPFPGTE